MHWDSIPPDYAVKAIAAKALARKNNSLDHGFLLGGLLTATTAGASALFCFPITFDEVKNWLIPVLGVSGVGLGLLLRAIYPAVQLPKCPSCAQDWTIREGKSVPLSQQMLTWDKCPGCGALMNDGLLQIAVKRGHLTQK